MLVWIQCYEENDLSGLLKHGKLDMYAAQAYEILQDQLVDTFGISTDFLKILKLSIRIEEMYAKQIKTGDKSNQLLINIAEFELEKLKNVPVKSDLYDSLVYIESALGFKLNPKEITVFDFYKYSKFVANKAKAA